MRKELRKNPILKYPCKQKARERLRDTEVSVQRTFSENKKISSYDTNMSHDTNVGQYTGFLFVGMDDTGTVYEYEGPIPVEHEYVLVTGYIRRCCIQTDSVARSIHNKASTMLLDVVFYVLCARAQPAVATTNRGHNTSTPCVTM